MTETKPPSGRMSGALGAMLSHAVLHSPYYREQEWTARLRSGARIAFREIPITGKSVVRAETARFYSDFVPRSDGQTHVKHTSGSTGEPLHVRKTDRAFRINTKENMRLRQGWDMHTHRRVVMLSNPQVETPIGTLREQVLPNGGRQWQLYTVDSRATFDIIRRTGATLAHGYPTVLLGALQLSAEASEPLPLQLLYTISEVVPDELRELVAKIPGCRLADHYGCIEGGLIAAQCPVCNAYHSADGHLVLELITDDGREAGPGEMGRVIITPLFNRAMPLIRYETGDYALRAERNDCARSPMGLARILGRQQNLFKLPDGRRIMPRLPGRVVERLGWRKFKLFQTTLQDVELHYVPQDPADEFADQLGQELVDMYMAPGFKVRCVRVADIPRAPNGKYFLHQSFV